MYWWLLLLALLVTLDARPIRTKRGYDDNFNVLLNLYKVNPLKQSNVFKSFSNRILLPRPGAPDLNYNAKESGEDKKVNATETNKEINIGNGTDKKDIKVDNIKVTLSIDKREDKSNDSLIHDFNAKLDTMSAEIMNILDLLQENRTQTKRPEVLNLHNILRSNENMQNASSGIFNEDDKIQGVRRNDNVEDKVNLNSNQSANYYLNGKNENNNYDKMLNANAVVNKTLNIDNDNFVWNNLQRSKIKDQYLIENKKRAENRNNRGKNRKILSRILDSGNEFKFYTEEYLKNTIFYGDDFGNEETYNIKDGANIDKKKFVNAEVVIF